MSRCQYWGLVINKDRAIMSRDLFLDGFIDRIARCFGLAKEFSFEVLKILAVLEFAFMK